MQAARKRRRKSFYLSGGEPFAVVLCHLGCFAESLGDLGGVPLRILAPFFDAELGRVDPNHAVLADAVLVEHAGDATGHLYGIEEFLETKSIYGYDAAAD